MYMVYKKLAIQSALWDYPIIRFLRHRGDNEEPVREIKQTRVRRARGMAVILTICMRGSATAWNLLRYAPPGSKSAAFKKRRRIKPMNASSLLS